jgi:putative FmdB family regulatory protein
MPLYEFRCPSGHAFEKFYRSIGSAPSTETCPECAQVAARRMSAAGLVFKGSGFYITDYGKDGKKDLRTAAAAKSSGSEAGAASKAGEAAAAAADGGAADAGTSKSTETPAAKTDSAQKPSTPAAAPASPSKKTE